MKTILTYGTFDLFHLGHVRLLRRLAALGDKLIVGCSTDEFNHLKRKKSVMSFEHRVEILEACRFVDKVIPERNMTLTSSSWVMIGRASSMTFVICAKSSICRARWMSRQHCS